MRYFEASPLFSLWVNERSYEKVIKVKAECTLTIIFIEHTLAKCGASFWRIFP